MAAPSANDAPQQVGALRPVHRMSQLLNRLIERVVTLRAGEARTALLMFAYSFLAMTAHNILRPVTRSKFISDLGADNLPWVQLGAGLIIGLLMHGYSVAAQRLPRRAVIPVTLAAEAVLLVVFWALFLTGAAWVSAALYLVGLMLGVLLISQFWTLANDIYDARQAKRIFGLIGGGASLGGAMGAAITAFAVERVGTSNLLLLSAGTLGLAVVVVMAVMRAQPSAGASLPVDERGVGAGEAIVLLRRSRQLQVIALIIGLAALASGVLDQQLMLAVAADKGESATNAIAAFLAQVTLWISLIGFVVQVGLTSRIHRSLGLAFALLILPMGLGSMAGLVIATGALWAAAGARVLDSSLRYTIDKTTREVLYLPLPADLKQSAKPFIDVTVDRFAKAMSGLLILVLIKPWGLNLTWQQLSYATLVIAVLWVGAAIVARREYLRAFRRGLSSRTVTPSQLRPGVADQATVETLVEELSSPDDEAVVLAIDMLDQLDKGNLVTPLLLHHRSPQVRARVLVAFESLRRSIREQWVPAVARLIEDEDPGVRSAAMRALAALRKDEADALLHQYLDDPAPRVAVAAAVVLASSSDPDARTAAAATFERLAGDRREATADSRRDVAAGLAHVADPALHGLLAQLILDPDVEVAREAIRSARALGTRDPIFVPALCALLSHRLLKRDARAAIVGYGADAVPVLAHLLADRDEHTWVRRHIPATLAMLPTQASMDVLAGTLHDADGFVRFKAIEAIEVLRRQDPTLRFDASGVDGLVLRETAAFCTYLTLRHNILRADASTPRSLLVRALDDKLVRILDRIYRLLGLIYPWKDIADARFTIEHGTGRLRAGALEYLDTLLRGPVRARVMPLIDDAPLDDKVRHANLVLKTRPRDVPETLAQLIHDDDPVLAAVAIHSVEQRGLWAELGDDVEYALAHRPVSDWYVFEAASWALAARRVGARRKTLWLEPLPAVELADRLRAVPLFDFVSVDELFRLARAGRQIGHEVGHYVYQKGASADAVQFLLDGIVRLSGDADAHELHAPAALAFEALVEGRPLATAIQAVDRVVCLRIDGREFLAMLSDSTEMTQGLFRMLLEGRHSAPATGLRPPAADDDGPSAVVRSIETARLLRRHPLLAHASIDQLMALAAVGEETPFHAGDMLVGQFDRPPLFHVLRGQVRLETDHATFELAGAGSTVFVEQALAGVSPGRRAMAASDGVALRIDRDVLFSALADNGGLLQGLFSGVSAMTREAFAQPASPDESPSPLEV